MNNNLIESKENIILNGLLKSQFFSNVDNKLLEQICKICHLYSFKKNEIIFSENDLALGFYIIIEGKVKIYKLSEAGKIQVIQIFNTGQSIGEAAIFMENKYPAFAEALTNSKLIFIKFDDFIKILKKEPMLSLNIIATLSMRLKSFLKIIEDITLNNSSKRLAKFLIENACKVDTSHYIIKLQTKKSILAEQLGITKETLSRILTKFKQQKLIKSEKNIIIILNFSKLSKLANI